MNGKVAAEFGGRVRIRVCGIHSRDKKILLINHAGLYSHDFWAPPGGGLNFNETMEEALKREYEEECHTTIRVGGFLFGCEFIRAPFHAIELYFSVELDEEPKIGDDPEIVDHQVISELKYWSWEEVNKLPAGHRHGVFQYANNFDEFIELKGFFRLT